MTRVPTLRPFIEKTKVDFFFNDRQRRVSQMRKQRSTLENRVGSSGPHAWTVTRHKEADSGSTEIYRH